MQFGVTIDTHVNKWAEIQRHTLPFRKSSNLSFQNLLFLSTYQLCIWSFTRISQ